jgi:hypothetical protein
MSGDTKNSTTVKAEDKLRLGPSQYIIAENIPLIPNHQYIAIVTTTTDTDAEAHIKIRFPTNSKFDVFKPFACGAGSSKFVIPFSAPQNTHGASFLVGHQRLGIFSLDHVFIYEVGPNQTID